MKSNLCPICQIGHLHSKTESVELEYADHTTSGDNHYSECDHCGSEQATTADAKFNKRIMIAFKKTVLGLLTGTEVRALRKQLGLNQEQAARVFGGGPVAFSKYEADDVMQSEAMDKLLRLARDIPQAAEKLMQDAGLNSATENQWHTDNAFIATSHQRYRSAKLVNKHLINTEVFYAEN